MPPGRVFALLRRYPEPRPGPRRSDGGKRAGHAAGPGAGDRRLQRRLERPRPRRDHGDARSGHGLRQPHGRRVRHRRGGARAHRLDLQHLARHRVLDAPPLPARRARGPGVDGQRDPRQHHAPRRPRRGADREPDRVGRPRRDPFRERPGEAQGRLLGLGLNPAPGRPARLTPLEPIDHLDLVVTSLERSLAFYRGLLEPLGYTRTSEIEGERGERVIYIGREGGRGSVSLREALSDSHEVPYDRYGIGLHHLAFAAPSRSVVDERAEWLRAQGAEIESGPEEDDYTPGYYALFLHDPDGIKLEIVHR